MIIDCLHHLHAALELQILIQSGQRATLIAHIGPQARSICGIVERVLQIIVLLTPHQTQITYTLMLLRGLLLLPTTHIIIAVHIGRHGRAASIVILILLAGIAIAIDAVVIVVAIALAIEYLSMHGRRN